MEAITENKKNEDVNEEEDQPLKVQISTAL